MSFKVQRGVVTFGADEDLWPESVTAVGSTSKAFAKINGNLGTTLGLTGGTTSDETNREFQSSCLLIDSDTIDFERSGSAGNNDHDLFYELIEWLGYAGSTDEIVVHVAETLAFAASDSEKTGTVFTPGDSSKCVVFITGHRSARNFEEASEMLCTAEIDTAGGVKAKLKRGSSTAAVNVSYVVVEFKGSNWSTEFFTHTFSAAGINETETIGSTTWTAAFLVSSIRVPQNENEDVGYNCWPGSTATTVHFRLNAGADAPGTTVVTGWVVRHSKLSVQHIDSITGSGTDHALSASQPQTVPEAITAIPDIAKAFVLFTSDSDGTTATYSAPFWNARLTSTTNVDFKRSRTNTGCEWALQVVDLSAFQIEGFLSQTLAAVTSSAAGVLPIVASVSQTLAAVTSSAASTLLIVGASSQSLAALTSSAAGAVLVAAVLSKTLANVTLASTAVGIIAATVSQTLQDLTSSASCKLPIVGAFSPTLGTLTLSSASTISTPSGVVAVTLDPVLLTCEATNGKSGQVDVTLAALTSTSDCDLIVQAALASTLGAATSSSAGVVLLVATAAPTLGDVTLSSTATIGATSGGVVNALLADLQSSAAGVLPIQAQVSASLEALTCSAHSGAGTTMSGAITFAALTSTSATKLPVQSVAAPALGNLTATGNLTSVIHGKVFERPLGDDTLSSAATLSTHGQLSRTLGTVTCSATADHGATIVAAFAKTLGSLTMLGVCTSAFQARERSSSLIIARANY